MNCTIPVLKINEDDCVGDSLGKHNYNALVLDTNTCNLKDLYFNSPNNVNTILYSLSAYVQNFQNIFNVFDDSLLKRILLATTRVKMLSSYWGKTEFTIQYPINSSTFPDDKGVAPLDAPALSATDLTSKYKLISNGLHISGQNYLLNNFPTIEYPEGAIINVVFLLYNLSPSPVDPDFIPSASQPDPFNLVTVDYGPSFTYTNRSSYANFSRDNIYLTQTITLRYINQNNTWNYFDNILQ